MSRLESWSAKVVCFRNDFFGVERKFGHCKASTSTKGKARLKFGVKIGNSGSSDLTELLV